MKKLFIFLGSVLWASATLFIRTLVRFSFLPQTKLNTRVISVGNLQAGGAGKTPLISQIAREAVAQGFSVCILTRGYQSEAEKKGALVHPHLSNSETLDPSYWGDEPVLLHSLCPEAWIGIGRNRIQQYHLAAQKKGEPFDLVLLDDGFQHWKIKKDLEILAWTSEYWGNVFFRDFPWMLKKADLVVWTKGNVPPCRENYVQLRYDFSNSLENLGSSSEIFFWLVTGVAHGMLVKKNLKTYFELNQMPHHVSRHLNFEDHKKYDLLEVQGILEQARLHQSRVILTGKDWVKWKYLGISRNDVEVVEPQLVFVKGEALWKKTLWEKLF